MLVSKPISAPLQLISHASSDRGPLNGLQAQERYILISLLHTPENRLIASPPLNPLISKKLTFTSAFWHLPYLKGGGDPLSEEVCSTFSLEFRLEPQLIVNVTILT